MKTSWIDRETSEIVDEEEVNEVIDNVDENYLDNN